MCTIHISLKSTIFEENFVIHGEKVLHCSKNYNKILVILDYTELYQYNPAVQKGVLQQNI